MDILINLLPLDKRNEIKNLRYIGIILKIGLVGVFALAVLAVFSYACLYLIGIEEKSIDEEISRFETSQSYRETLNNQNSLREYDKIAGEVRTGFEKQKKHWDVISEINSIVPDGIVLTHFAVSEEGELSLNGLAYTRDALLQLKEGLEKSELLEDIVSPISNFVVETDVKFEFTAKVK